jgi:hypothetical protein
MDLEGLPPQPISHATAGGWGLSPSRLRRAIRHGLVRPVLRGVYLRSDVSLTLEVKLAAAALVISPSAVACDRTAAWIWGVDVHEYRELDDLPAIETFVLRGNHRSERPEIRGGERDLLPCDWVEVGAVKVTTPLRTAMDLGCRLPRRQGLAAMDALMRAHRITRADLARSLPRYRRRRGVVQLRELVPLADPRAESQPESWTRLEMLDRGLPAPELQFWVVVDGIPTYRLDLAYPHARIAVEYDGEEFHSSIDDRERDRLRRAWLREHGWTVIVIVRSCFARDADLSWISQIEAALRHARRPTYRPYAQH